MTKHQPQQQLTPIAFTSRDAVRVRAHKIYIREENDDEN